MTDNCVALSKKAFPSSKVVNVYSYVFSKSFTALALKIRSMIHFKLISVYDVS